MAIVPALWIMLVLFIGCAVLINTACSGLSSNTILDLSLGALGLFGCVVTGAEFVLVLWELVRITNVCSGVYTYKKPPTILSIAYRTMSSEHWTESERRDLDRFIHYVSKANVGARLFDITISMGALLQLAAGVSVFTWLVVFFTRRLSLRHHHA